MRFSALLLAAAIAGVPVAAWADDPPVHFVEAPVAQAASVEVDVWIAYGYGKQILIDHDWDGIFGINTANAAKKDGDVRVRFDLGNCDDAEASLVAQLGAWFALHPTELPTAFFRLADDGAGWLWSVGQSLSNCTCGAATVVTYHCANGAVHSTCDAEEEACGPAGTATVQAYNRPANEKCETDLTGDGLFECDAAAFGSATGGEADEAIRFRASGGNPWTFLPAAGCTDAEFTAGTCVATCHANNRNGTTTTITVGYEGVSQVTPGTCTNMCAAIAEDTLCVPPGGGTGGQPDADDTGSGSDVGGRNPHDPRLRKASPADLWAPPLQQAKRRPARIDVNRPFRIPLE